MKLFYYAAAAAAMASAVFCSCDKQDEGPPPQPEIAPVQFVGVTALDVVTVSYTHLTLPTILLV